MDDGARPASSGPAILPRALEAGTLTDRAAFLERVRAELAAPSSHDVPDLPSVFPATPASGSADEPLVPRFVREVAGAGGVARVLPIGQVAEAVAEAIRGVRSDRRVVVTDDLGDLRDAVHMGLADAQCQVIALTPAGWREEAAAADWGITGAVLAVAATGSVLLAASRGSPRVASLLPPNHLVLVRVDRLVAGLEDTMPVAAALSASSSATVLVTGPSRTSDIEMTTVLGMHGPRTVRILLVE